MTLNLQFLLRWVEKIHRSESGITSTEYQENIDRLRRRQRTLTREIFKLETLKYQALKRERE